MKNTIALLGTSADPPTFGHQKLLKGLINFFPKVITWASDNPDKHHGIPLKKRHQLLKVIVQGIASQKLELVQDLSSPRTIDSLKRAKLFWPDSKFIFIIGSDLIEQVPSWFKAQSLLQETLIGIAPRDGWPIEMEQINRIESLGGTVKLLPLQIPASSSSNFRANPNKALIPPEILPMILKENLYEIASNN